VSPCTHLLHEYSRCTLCPRVLRAPRAFRPSCFTHFAVQVLTRREPGRTVSPARAASPARASSPDVPRARTRRESARQSPSNRESARQSPSNRKSARQSPQSHEPCTSKLCISEPRTSEPAHRNPHIGTLHVGTLHVGTLHVGTLRVRGLSSGRSSGCVLKSPFARVLRRRRRPTHMHTSHTTDRFLPSP
jgi:hypothetical protein